MILLDLPELRLERGERLPRRLGDLERARVVAFLARSNSIRLQSVRSAPTLHSLAETETHIPGVRKEAEDLLVRGLGVLCLLRMPIRRQLRSLLLTALSLPASPPPPAS